MDDADKAELEHLVGWMESAARSLERLRRKTENEIVLARRALEEDRPGEVVSRASHVVHEVAWGVANMQVDRPGSTASGMLGRQRKPSVGSLDDGVPDSTDHTKRGFQPK